VSNYVITWENDGIKYLHDSVNTPSVYTMETTDELGNAKVYEDLIHAEVERKLIVRFTNETYATTITVTDRELFEARLKGE
jgi:hypothetical protein